MQYFVSYSHCLGPIEYNVKHIHFVKLYCSKITQVSLTQTSPSKYLTLGSLTDLPLATQSTHYSLNVSCFYLLLLLLLLFADATPLTMLFHLPNVCIILKF